MKYLKIEWEREPITKKGFPLFATDFSKLKIRGVYVIWEANEDVPIILKVGSSKDSVGERLSKHQKDMAFLKYKNRGSQLYTTWAEVPLECIDGVEKFLGENYRPQLGDLGNDEVRFPDVEPILVDPPSLKMF